MIDLEDCCPEHSAHDRAITHHDKRLDAHGEQLDKLSAALASLTEIEKQNQVRIDKMDERISVLESVPASRWNKASEYALTAVLGAAIGFFANHFVF